MKELQMIKASTLTPKKIDTWYLNYAPDGTTFWDSYVHYQCEALKITKVNPFNKGIAKEIK